MEEQIRRYEYDGRIRENQKKFDVQSCFVEMISFDIQS